jgi:hypothetical protein
MNIVKLPSYPLSFICFDKQQGQFLNDEALEAIPISEFFNKNPRYIVLQSVGEDQDGSLCICMILCVLIHKTLLLN